MPYKLASIMAPRPRDVFIPVNCHVKDCGQPQDRFPGADVGLLRMVISEKLVRQLAHHSENSGLRRQADTFLSLKRRVASCGGLVAAAAPFGTSCVQLQPTAIEVCVQDRMTFEFVPILLSNFKISYDQIMLPLLLHLSSIFGGMQQ